MGTLACDVKASPVSLHCCPRLECHGLEAGEVTRSVSWAPNTLLFLSVSAYHSQLTLTGTIPGSLWLWIFVLIVNTVGRVKAQVYLHLLYGKKSPGWASVQCLGHCLACPCSGSVLVHRKLRGRKLGGRISDEREVWWYPQCHYAFVDLNDDLARHYPL